MNKPIKRTIQIGLLVIILGVIIIPRTGLFSGSDSQNVSTSNRNNGLPVTAVILEPGVLENSIRGAGTLLASEDVDVTTEISGQVRSVYFSEGSYVKKGDLLVRIDNSELLAQRQKAVHQRELISETLERQRALLEKEAISREAFDRVQTDFLVIESEINLLDTRIEKTAIRAPFSGTIGFRYVSPGAWLQPGNRVARLVKTDPLRIQFSVPERYQSAGLIGRDVVFSVAGFDDSFRAKVYAVDPSVDTRTRSLLLRAEFPNPDSKLLPGMFADIRMVISREDDVVKVPSEAVIPQMDGELIYVYRSGRAVQIPIQSGQRTEREIAVTDGLVVGDTVITSGILQLRSGMPVTLRNINQSAMNLEN
ncbi:efflux RND transporter periplasmic adaptor subunit [Alkalitalea saponilacus]|uniref:Membrane fusion protein, multidrug efflux system n=1 Tax=Alkalitalea saponilacus TaxID=889453 RepID=A0A1T5HRZ8_9BACT|nr:efflux RND transporter periplasmic adaptor subunit [Alkalitalea saponilacus]ASB50021.1 efflux RND transporter periplasmic adaptor subunit [Alkalitalea saponilacus]SKC23466.1 membrane fusion protein, multidrug efflux system [Alkalitalea saponilacus]